MGYKLAQINLSPAKSQVLTDIHISQPDAIKESLVGKLLLLAEIDGPRSDSLKILNFLIDRLSNNYYQNEKIILRERISTLKAEHIFEAALAKTNKNLADFLEQEKIKVDLDKISVTACVLHENQLHFATTGRNKVLLIYPDPEGGAEGYKSIDLVERSAAAAKPNTQKFFSNVVSGEMIPRSYFIISNEALGEYISARQLLKFITTLPPVSAVEQIKNLLSSINSYVPFLSILIKSTAAQAEKIPAARSRAASQESIAGLNLTEERTESLLSPSGRISPGRGLKNTLYALFSRQKETSPGAAGAGLKEKIYFKKNPFYLLKKSSRLAGRTAALLFGLLARFFGVFTDKNRLGRAAKQSYLKSAYFLDKTILGFLKLSLRNKILLLVALVSLVVFAFRVGLNRQENMRQAETREYRELAELIEKKQNQAEASLLYNNEESAKRLFDEIQQLMQDLPRLTDEQQQRFDEFKRKLNEQLEKARRVTRVDNPPELADFVNLSSQAQPDNLAYIPGSGRIYAADSAAGSIYILETADNITTTFTDLDTPIETLLYPAAMEDESIYYLNGSNLLRFDPATQSLSLGEIELPGAAGGIRGIDTYSSRLYLLDSPGSQIYRYNQAEESFSAPQAWLEAEADLEQAVDLSIDGHIYVLLEDGRVLKYLRGQRIEFSLDEVDPPISAAAKLYVSPELKYIYLLEPANSRLVIYDKTGQFLLQYTSDKFIGLKDFAVDEAAKIIYFLAGSRVYGIEAVHFDD